MVINDQFSSRHDSKPWTPVLMCRKSAKSNSNQTLPLVRIAVNTSSVSSLSASRTHLNRSTLPWHSLPNSRKSMVWQAMKNLLLKFKLTASLAWLELSAPMFRIKSRDSRPPLLPLRRVVAQQLPRALLASRLARVSLRQRKPPQHQLLLLLPRLLRPRRLQ